MLLIAHKTYPIKKKNQGKDQKKLKKRNMPPFLPERLVGNELLQAQTLVTWYDGAKDAQTQKKIRETDI